MSPAIRPHIRRLLEILSTLIPNVAIAMASGFGLLRASQTPLLRFDEPLSLRINGKMLIISWRLRRGGVARRWSGTRLWRRSRYHRAHVAWPVRL